MCQYNVEYRADLLWQAISPTSAGVTPWARFTNCLRQCEKYCKDLLKTHSEMLMMKRRGHSYFLN